MSDNDMKKIDTKSMSMAELCSVNLLPVSPKPLMVWQFMLVMLRLFQFLLQYAFSL